MGDMGIGVSMKRREDFRFLTGKGRYTDDINRPGQTHAYMLRSPHAHAKITKLDRMTPSARVSLLMLGPNSATRGSVKKLVPAIARKCTDTTAMAKQNVPRTMFRLVRFAYATQNARTQAAIATIDERMIPNGV